MLANLQKVDTSHQVDEVLVADLSVGVAIGEGQQDFQFMGVQLRAVGRQQVPEPLRTDEARILWVILQMNTNHKSWKMYMAVENRNEYVSL